VNGSPFAPDLFTGPAADRLALTAVGAISRCHARTLGDVRGTWPAGTPMCSAAGTLPTQSLVGGSVDDGRSVTAALRPADEQEMTSAVVGAPDESAAEEYRVTSVRCLTCVTTLSLDDDRPKMGTLRWRVTSNSRVTIGRAVSFDCPNGHSSATDPQLLRAFPSRRF
jgi:hypothetical protein